jgi:uncharacterized membrane protein
MKAIVDFLKSVIKFVNKFAKLFFRIFEASIIIKGIDGVLQIIGSGILFYVSRPERLDKIIIYLTQHEFSQDPHDFISYNLAQFVEHLTANSFNFGALYLLIHGILKVFIVIMLLQKRLWAYPVAIGSLLIFSSYEFYRFDFMTHSIPLLVFSIYDFITAILTLIVFLELKRKHSPLSRVKTFAST